MTDIHSTTAAPEMSMCAQQYGASPPCDGVSPLPTAWMFNRGIIALYMAFALVSMFGIYVTVIRLPPAVGPRRAYVTQSWTHRAQGFQDLQTQLQHDIQRRESESEVLFDKAVEMLAPQTIDSHGREQNQHNQMDESWQGLRSRSGTGVVPNVTPHQPARNHLTNKGHPVLEMDHGTFSSTSLGDAWGLYSHRHVLGPDSCEADFGYDLMLNWRALGQSYCQPHRKGGSELKCHVSKQNHHAGKGDNLCVGTNIRMNFRELSDPKVTDTVMQRYVESRHSDEAYVHFRRGLMAGTCTLDMALWKKDVFPGWNADVLFNGFEALPQDEVPEDTALGCDMWIEHPVLLVQRDTFANLFHDSEDFVNAFLAMAILDWNLGDTQIFLTDLYPKGPFWDMWQRVYNQGHAPKTAWDLKNEFGDKNVCFRQVAVSIYGPGSPLTLNSFRTECERSSLVRAYADTVIRGMGLQHLTHYAQPHPSNTIRVTWMARRASVIWPERNFCSDNSFFRCNLFQHLNTRKLGRMVMNDAEVVTALKALEHEVFPSGANVKVQAVDFNVLSFEEQIKVDLETDIMVGPHGAGLMHSLFMPDRGVLMELFIDQSAANQHFHNMARWYGRRYVSMVEGNPVPVDDVLSRVREVIATMDLSQW